ncbi:hypothetical protein GGX14DRAFT_664393, partial [Mycena pura]
STLYRKRATGFGEWDVNIAPRAEQDLRQLNKRDPKTVSFILKKMRELSNGNFYPDNYEQINGATDEIPIYQTKVTEKLRLVYQVDCVPMYGSNVLLKVFGVYQDAQLSGSFWNAVSRELARKGKYYGEKCSIRRRASDSQTHEKYVFVPATFPTHQETRTSSESVSDLPADDAEQARLDAHAPRRKTVHFSEYLLRSILDDLDVAFVLEISPRELEIVEHPHSCYVLGRSGTGKTTTMLYKMLLVEASGSELSTSRKIRQLFVTQSHTLAHKVGEHFGKLIRGYRPSAISENLKAAEKADRALVAREEGNELRSDLPKKYSELQDADFPLFVSMEQLCTMIECDIVASTDRKKQSTRLTYDKFRREYWPRFPQSLCKGFEPSMVFSEFMGVIKGSEVALNSKSHYLDRTTYLNIGQRRQTTFADQRSRIYDLFEKYLAQKGLQGDADPADRTLAILESFHKHGVPGNKIDYLCVRYVFDYFQYLINEFIVLRSLCQDPNSLFWAGDTAQTISVGSSFRFNELKSFLHRIEERRKEHRPELAFAPAVPPSMFQLTMNYRSHAGIINCAHSVIELITTLWPDAIDKLEPEKGTVHGSRPVFFTNWDLDDIHSKQFLFGDQPSGSYVELGAEQCILVRDKAARNKLVQDVGNIGLIMTLHEAKGLEFNDAFEQMTDNLQLLFQVLIYNFFADSEVSEAQWRVVLNVVGHGVPAPAFDSVRHASVCMELKFLYVAITRARNNIWIADCSTKGESLRIFWTSRSLVQNRILGTDARRFAISSTPSEWREQGRKLFDSNHFWHAKICYERAMMPHEAAISQAYHLREEASGMPQVDHREINARMKAFLSGAAAFMACARKEMDAKTSQQYFCEAAACFEQAEKFDRAIAAYGEGRAFTKVAVLYLELSKFKEAVATIQIHSQDIDRGVAERVTVEASLYYYGKEQIKKATDLFPRPEDALKLLLERKMHKERAAVLEMLGKLSEAAEIHCQEGRTLKAIELFLRDRKTDRASSCVIKALWERLPFAVLPDTTHDNLLGDLLKLAAQVDLSLVSQNERDEISMFHAIVDRNAGKLQELGLSFVDQNPAATLLCLDHYFLDPPGMHWRNLAGIDALVKNLEGFHAYVKLLENSAFSGDPCGSSTTRKLFGYVKKGEDAFSIPHGTFLRTSRRILTGDKLRPVFERALRDRLARRIREQNDMCRAHTLFQGPCLTFALSDGGCDDDDCPQEHILASSFGSQEYSLRVRIHVLQILIYHSLAKINVDDSESQRSFWISRLYAALLDPVSHKLGSAASLDFELIPEAARGFQVAKEWVRRGCAYTLESAPQSFLARMVELVHLAVRGDGSPMAYFERARFKTDPLVNRRGQDAVAEFLSALDGQDRLCLTAGVTFLRHVIMERLPIRFSDLCDVAENVCAALVVADGRGSLHGITLPLSWLVRRANAAGGLLAARVTNMSRIFVRYLSELLEPLYTGVDAGHLLSESERLDSGFMTRNRYLTRVCRCLCLLADNLGSDSLCKFVLESITALRRDPERHFPSLSSRYVNARTWSDLEGAVKAEATDGDASTCEEVVQLFYASSLDSPPLDAAPGVRRIVYEKRADIPRLLDGSATRTTATDLVPQSSVAGLEPEVEIEADDHASEYGNNDADERLPEDVPIDLPPISEPSQEELNAAAVIRRAISRAHYRNEQRKQAAGKSSLATGLSKFYDECRLVSLGMVRLYRFHFLGPLPHLLLCLDMVYNWTQKEMKQSKKEFRSAEHEALERAGQRLSTLQETLKKVIGIRKALGPTSEIHARRNIDELKSWTEQAAAVLRTLPFEAPPGLDEHFGIAYKGIVQ